MVYPVPSCSPRQCPELLKKPQAPVETVSAEERVSWLFLVVLQDPGSECPRPGMQLCLQLRRVNADHSWGLRAPPRRTRQPVEIVGRLRRRTRGAGPSTRLWTGVPKPKRILL